MAHSSLALTNSHKRLWALILLSVFALQWGMMLIGGNDYINFQPHLHTYQQTPSAEQWRQHWLAHLQKTNAQSANSQIASVYSHVQSWWRIFGVEVLLTASTCLCIILPIVRSARRLATPQLASAERKIATPPPRAS